MYIIGQIFGILVTLCCIICPFWKKRGYILATLLASNLFATLSFLFLEGRLSPSVTINFVAIFHTAISMHHETKGKTPPIAEKLFFLAVYLLCGFMGYNSAIDLLPVAAAILFMLSVFQKKEQNMRICNTLNAIAWLIYNIIIGSTAVAAHVISITTNIASYIKYKKES